MTDLDKQHAIKRGNPGWVKGQSGNPNGRPKGTLSLVSLLKQQLLDNPGEAKEIVKAFVEQGKVGDMRAIEELLNRIDGKVIERHKLEAEIPITLLFQPASQLQSIEGKYKEIDAAKQEEE